MRNRRKRAEKLLRQISPAKRARYLKWRNELSDEQKVQYAEYLRKRIAAKKV